MYTQYLSFYILANAILSPTDDPEEMKSFGIETLQIILGFIISMTLKSECGG